MSEPTQQEVINAINQGIINAQTDYNKANNSDIISEYCPEYYLTVYIFQSLLKLKKEYEQEFWLSVEESAFTMKNGLKIPGRPFHLISSGRKCDVALKDSNDCPLVVIEVKKNPFEYQENIERLSYLASRGLKYGVFASCLFLEVENTNFEGAKDKLEGITEDISSHIKNLTKEWKYDLLVEKHAGEIQDFLEESKIYKWCPVCYVICDKTNRR